MNADLKEALRQHFEPLGIVAYSGCCRWGCTGAYDESSDDFKVRKDPGIFYIRLHLSGMNYNTNPGGCFAMYQDFNYLMSNWDQECKHIEDFCRILGLSTRGQREKTLTLLAMALQCPVPVLAAVSANWPKRYKIEKPESQDRAVGITFNQPLELQPYEEEEED